MRSRRRKPSVTEPVPLRIVRTPRRSVRWSLELLWTLAVHRINIRYKETLFGFGWIFLQPVALTIIFNYIHRVARIPTGEIPYPLFAAVGLVVWSITALVLSQSTICLTSQAPLLKRIALPRIFLPLSVLFSSIADLCVMGLLLVGLFLYYQRPPGMAWAWIPILLLLHFSLLMGLSCLVSLANVFLKDIGHALPFLLQIWFFASPVFYPYSMVPREFRMLARWIPLTGIIEGYRAALLSGQPPPLELLGPTFLATILISAVGILLFKKIEGTITDML